MCSFEGVFLFYFCNLSSFFGGRVEVVARKILGQGYVHNLEHNLCVNKNYPVSAANTGQFTVQLLRIILRRYPDYSIPG